MADTNSRLMRIGVFYDGNWFAKVDLFYHDTRGGHISLPGLHDFIREEVGRCEGADKRHCSIVDMHYFRGRFPAESAIRHNSSQLYRDRKFDDMLMREGVVTHYLPMRINAKTGRAEEKGIDVWLALEAHELAIYKRYDVCVLVAGDGDYVPLVKKLTTLGTRTMILWWEIPGRHKKPPTSASRDLLKLCTYPVSMHNVIDDKAKAADPIVRNLLYYKKKPEPALTRDRLKTASPVMATAHETLAATASSAADETSRETGTIGYLDYEKDNIWIKADNNPTGFKDTGSCKRYNFPSDATKGLHVGMRVTFVRDSSRDIVKHGKRLWLAKEVRILPGS